MKKSDREKNLSVFEAMTPKGISYWFFWPTVGLLFFIGSELILRYYAETYLLVTRLIFSACIGIFPLMIISASREFRPTMKNLSTLLWNNDQEFDTWCTERERRIFTLETRQARLISAFIVLGGVVTILLTGLPLKNSTANLLGILGFIDLMAICGIGGVVLIELLFTLAGLTKKDVRVPFFFLPHPAFTRLQSYYSLSAVFVTGSYVLLVVAVWQGPYGLTPSMLIWLAMVSFYPLGMFIWSTFQIHVLIQKAKYAHLETANSRVQAILQKTIENGETKDYEQLEKAMNIQLQVQNLSEWPVAISGTITLLVTITTAVVQTFISLLTVLKP